MEGILCQPSCQHVVVDAFRINELHGRQVIGQQLATVFRIHQVLGKGLEGIRSKIGIIALTGVDEAT